MFEHVRCVIVRCGQCRDAAEIDDTIVHFDTREQAARELADLGWRFAPDTALCGGCADKQDCARHGHVWDRWLPCGCRGDVAAHRDRYLTVAAIDTGSCASQTRWCQRCAATEHRATTTMGDAA